jgi:hypothetical protein
LAARFLLLLALLVVSLEGWVYLVAGLEVGLEGRRVLDRGGRKLIYGSVGRLGLACD